MTEREKVIEALEACVLKDPDDSRDCRHCPRCNYGAFITNSCINGVMADALALLKAQEPVKPVVDVDTWTCGNCGHTLEHQKLLGDNVLFHEQYNYCPECGRAVKWE